VEWLFLAIAAVLYFVPAGVARVRGHGRADGILWLNLALGWTLIGWVLVLVWALSNPGSGPEPAPPGDGS
jgi:hypothetical protein